MPCLLLKLKEHDSDILCLVILYSSNLRKNKLRLIQWRPAPLSVLLREQQNIFIVMVQRFQREEWWLTMFPKSHSQYNTLPLRNCTGALDQWEMYGSAMWGRLPQLKTLFLRGNVQKGVFSPTFPNWKKAKLILAVECLFSSPVK